MPSPGMRLPMDHPVHGVQATVIDLGLSRMDACGDGGLTEIRWTPFDEEIFEGEGQQLLSTGSVRYSSVI